MIQKILIADDEPEILSAFAELLQCHGFEVCTAGSSDEFEKVFFEESPDLIILDIAMPGESGPDLYDRVMRIKDIPSPPVIFASGLVDSHSESPLVKGRQVAMYAKPVNVGKLAHDIRTTFPIAA